MNGANLGIITQILEAAMTLYSQERAAAIAANAAAAQGINPTPADIAAMDARVQAAHISMLGPDPFIPIPTPQS